MAVYPSRFTGIQIDDVIGLFDNKGLNNVEGIIERNENGTFSIADLSWVAEKSETVNAISYDSVNKKIIQSIDGVNSDVVSVATLMDDFGVGEANGIVPLNSSSKIDSIFLPSYVDDVLEYDGLSNFPETGETGKIYVDITTNKTYRWSGSIYVEISPSPIIPTNISAFVNDSGYITGYTETDPIFSASPAAGISATDISNWNAKVSDDHKWNDVSLTHDLNIGSDNDFYVPIMGTVDGTVASFNIVSKTPMNYAIAKYGTGAYLYSTTPSANDNSTKVATTAWVNTAMSGAGAGTVTSVGISNATNGGLLISDSPITSSGSITIGHSNVLTSAQTTSGIYPIKIDKNGHISEYGSAVNIPSISLNGSSTTSASFYAPTTVGTSGYYLKSNGSGAPTWASVPAGVTVTLNGSTTTTPSFYAPTTVGTSGQVLTSNGSDAPTWAAARSGSSTQIIHWTES